MKGGILIITKNFPPDIGGVESYITEFIHRYLKKYNRPIYVICPLKGVHLSGYLKNTSDIEIIAPTQKLTFINLDATENFFLSAVQSLLYYFFIFGKGIKLMWHKREKIASLYGIGGPFAILPTLILGRIFQKRCFGHIHADFQFASRPKIAQFSYKAMLSSLDRVFVNSEDAWLDLSKIDVNPDQVGIINNWVNPEIFGTKDRKKCRQELCLPLDKKILLFVGRLSKEKGILEVLDCADIFKCRNGFLFVIIGDGPLRTVVEERVAGRTDALFLGPKKNTELVDYYNAADLLLWGAVDSHYVSITVMEALNCGLPVIAPSTSAQGGKVGREKFYVQLDTLPPEVGMLVKSSAVALAEGIDEFFNAKKFDQEKIKRYGRKKYSAKNAEEILTHLK